MPPGDCEILRPFCCPADGAAMGAAAPGRGIWKGSKEGEAGRAQGAGRQALPAFGGFGTPSMRVPRGLAATSAHYGRACRPSLSGRACRPAPCALPAWCLSFSFVRQHARARLLPWLRVARLFAFVPVFARKYAILSDL